MMNGEKVIELLKNGEFLAKLEKTNSNEEAQKLFAAEGVSLDIDKVQDLREALTCVLEDPKAISEESLDNVSGGGVLKKAAYVVIGAGMLYGGHEFYKSIADEVKNRGGYKEGWEKVFAMPKTLLGKAQDIVVDILAKPK